MFYGGSDASCRAHNLQGPSVHSHEKILTGGEKYPRSDPVCCLLITWFPVAGGGLALGLLLLDHHHSGAVHHGAGLGDLSLTWRH